MRVREYTSPHQKPKKRRLKVWHGLSVVLLAALVVLAVFGIKRYQQAIPTLTPIAESPTVYGKVTIPWPSYGQAAIGASGYGVLASGGVTAPRPIASVAKVMTALAILKQKPLNAGESGPAITFTDADVAIYNAYVAKDGSVVQVNSGEQMSEYQALEAMLLPSANNIADSLSIWAYGSIAAENAAANAMATQLGMTGSHFEGDASGFEPTTTSTARDLVILGETALQNPVIAGIVSQTQADLPIAGTVHNVNQLLNTNGINGIKTGNTDQAGGCFLVSALHTYPGGQKVTVVMAIMNAPSLLTVINDAQPLMLAAQNGFGPVTGVHAGEEVGKYNLPWGGDIVAVSSHDITTFGWQGTSLKAQVQLKSLSGKTKAGQTVGSVTETQAGQKVTSDAMLARNLTTPPWRWRLKYVLGMN